MSDLMPDQGANKTELVDGSDSLFSGLPQEIMSNLTPAKMRMIILWLSGQYTQRKIGQIIGVSDNTIRTWLMDPAVQTVIAELQSREFAIIESNLKALSVRALKTMDELLDSNMDNVRFQAARDLLDRSGHKPQQSIKVDKTVTTLEQSLASVKEFNIDPSKVVDVDISDILEEVKASGSR